MEREFPQLDFIKKAAQAAGVDANFGTHSLRRGAAQNMVEAGCCTLLELLNAGNWNSKAFKQYLSMRDIVQKIALSSLEKQVDPDLTDSDDDA